MSSKLIPPKVGAIFSTVCINSSGSLQLTSISKTSIPANLLNNTPLPSITGFPANAPTLPSPSTAVPSVITATKFPLFVYLYAFFASLAISLTGTATPGVYARDSSSAVSQAFDDSTLNFPGFGYSW